MTGYDDAVLGIGEAYRQAITGFEGLGLAPTALSVPRVLGEPALDRPGAGIWYVHCNAPEALAVLARATAAFRARRYLIGYWAYELPQVPPLWRSVAAHFDEIWVPSRFVAEAFTGTAPSIRVMPHFFPVPPPRAVAVPGRCRLLASGDVRSSLVRKNLAGAIDLYRLAVPSARNGISLTLKILRAEEAPAAVAGLRSRAGGRPDIHFVTDVLSETAMTALWEATDLVLSPHRAEGFGLMIAEALARGLPALATAWSGNLDFMEGLDPFLIPASKVPVRDEKGPYRAGRGQVWAAPDLHVGAEKLRALLDDPQGARALAENGRDKVLALKDQWDGRVADHPRFAALRDGG